MQITYIKTLGRNRVAQAKSASLQWLPAAWKARLVFVAVRILPARGHCLPTASQKLNPAKPNQRKDKELKKLELKDRTVEGQINERKE